MPLDSIVRIMKRFLSTTIILLFMLFAHAQSISDLASMRELATLLCKGKQHSAYIEKERLQT